MTPGSSPLESQLPSSFFIEAVQQTATELEHPAPSISSSNHQDGSHVLDESTQEQTMIGSEDVHGLTSDWNTLSQPKEDNPLSMKEENIKDLGINEKDSGEALDPLRTRHEVHELTVVAEDGNIVDTVVDNTDSQLEKKPSPVASNRASHLHLDLRPPSAQPWDLVDPPDTDDAKGNPDYYTPLGSRKFRTLQSTTHTRPFIPKSSYYFGPPPSDSAFYTPPVGQIGLHHPREIIRIERDYTGGELIQFAPIYPVELEGRITPTQFLESINAINELLISAHSLRHSFLDNTLAVLTLQLSRLFVTSHYDKEMQKLRQLVDSLNVELYNPVGLNILWPRNVAFLYLLRP
ncbi:hypothetical protein C0995_008542 [Termitomyces sp. Mi166|nr:hypothetical protein C0995_008542 [Termitomyces sp. Mi166\